ncbi:NAD-dependent formate dehydrogenase delta subunit [Caballeronia glathei]|jgi:formate dehydrogenase subunit delta|uniref:Formate dehydrogenase n=1 Tax=Caballeronia glathei TaxID=60547 RepID=A0A069PJ47_9BURK|nr:MULTISPECIES: formate dehydrogenase subunit delta [Burkholderiaceae]KDR40397.1 formate dehydrogenase [Caballeronia glathei]TCK42855.1 formate dehydrogenase delta subunit [Paraburkholderia sp. BL8N3]CDY75958.1 NAD-dependent formate dehydrogenase delta subunit [Caballeronia glathei]
MDVDNLIDMANRIGEFFDSLPDQHEAADSVADHIRKFWEPRMRLAILNSLDNPEASAAMHAIVREALETHRKDLTPAAATA